MQFRPARVEGAAKAVAVTTVCLAPGVAAIDHGGVFAWTQWWLAVAGMVALLLSCIGLWRHDVEGLVSRARLPLLLLIAAGLAWLQTVPDAGITAGLWAGGSRQIYSAWLQPLHEIARDSEAVSEPTPASLAPWLTWRSLSGLLTAALFGWIAVLTIERRQRIAWMLTLIALTGAVHAGLGIYTVLRDPTVSLWGMTSSAPLGGFLNGNNACTLIVIGLGASCGLLAWRTAALSSFRVGYSGGIDTFRELALDRAAVFAALTMVVSFAGLLVSGSRAGLAGGVLAAATVAIAFQIASRGRGLVVGMLALGVVAALLLLRFEMPLRSWDELNSGDGTVAESVLRDGRLQHWPDGWQAALYHLPSGAGLGAYRYAYLPHQTSDIETWFLHADNLWLEWFVEMGLGGVLLLLLALVWMIRGIVSLSGSEDPLHFGLALAGTFVAVGVGFTQFFDFGLTLLPSATLTAVLSSVVISQGFRKHADTARQPAAVATDAPRSNDARLEPRVLPRPLWRMRPEAIALTGIMAAAGGVAIDTFHRQAVSEFLTRSVSTLVARSSVKESTAADLSASLQKHVVDNPLDTSTRLALARLEVHQLRQRAVSFVQQEQPGTPEPELRRRLSASQLRATWYRELGTQPETTGSPAALLVNDEEDNAQLPPDTLRFRETLATGYAGIRRQAISALRSAPLSDEARYYAVLVDFAGGSPRQSEGWLRQLAKLRGHNYRSLKQVIGLAEVGEMWPLVRDLWRRVLVLHPPSLGEAMRSVHRQGPLRPSDVVPPTMPMIRKAALMEMNRPDPDERLLMTATDVLRAGLLSSGEEKFDRLLLLARIDLKRNRPAVAVESLQHAAAIRPQEVTVWEQLTEALLAADQAAAASEALRNGLKLHPKNPRLRRLRQQLPSQLQSTMR